MITVDLPGKNKANPKTTDRSGAGGSAGDAPNLGPSEFALDIHEKTFDELSLVLRGRLWVENAEEVRAALMRAVEHEPLKNVVVDLSEIDYIDSSGAAVLMELHRKCREMNNMLKLARAGPSVRRFLDLVDFDHFKDKPILRPRAAPPLLVQIGGGAERIYHTVQDIIMFIGAASIALYEDLRHPRQAKWDPLWKLIERSGSDAVPIVAILSFLMGAILAFQAAIQLRKFGANVFVADLVSVSICLEMGPLLAAIIVAGRSGAAYAAHIGAMQVTEEVDALRLMGVDPIRYLVSPRIVAVGLTLPCLTIFADIVGILGGCVVSVFALDLTPITYFNQVGRVLEVSDVVKGLIKSFAYGVEIAAIGCLRGFQVRGGAESVGQATTSAVVTSVFVLTVTDAIFAMFYHYTRFL
ncbi:MAG: MlaE family lipid ABC transporter permease subunit [Deltaproteobacteria bacterium]|nr:MlaE family lipid ABC transporter permease subunit [Deltaproteobacteria bacterium]